MTEERIPVIQLIDGFATEEHPGGAAQFGIRLAQHLDRTRYTPFVCGLWKYGTPSERRWRERLADQDIGTTILIENRTVLMKDMVRAALRLRGLIEATQAKVINSHFERGDVLALVSKVAGRPRLKIVRTMHADEQWQRRPWLGQLLNLVAFPWLFDGEVAISKATKRVMDRRMAARLRGRKASLLYNGIPRDFIDRVPGDEDCQGARAGPHRQPRIGIIGRLERQKGHRYFLQAAAGVLEHVPDAEFWIVGTGSLDEALRTLVEELGIEAAVHFLGQRSDIPDILGQLTMLVSASIWEGFPTVILEAMAACVPVVATDVSGSRELVRGGKTGLLVPARRPDELARAMLWMYRHPEQATAMAVTARREVSRYTIEQTAEGYDRLYSKILQ